MIEKATLRIEGTDVQIMKDEKFFGCVCLPTKYTWEKLNYYFEEIGERSFKIIQVVGADCYILIDNETEKYLTLKDLIDDNDLRKDFEYCQKALMNEYKAWLPEN